MVPPETQKNEIEEGTADQRESYDEEIDPDFDFPKVVLHCHLDGSFRISTVIDLAKQRGIELVSYDEKELRKYAVWHVQENATLAKFLDHFKYFAPVFKGSRYAIRRLTLEAIEDFHRRGIVYIELRFSPHLLATIGNDPLNEDDPEEKITPEEVLEEVLKANKIAAEKYPSIMVRFLLCGIVAFPQWSQETAELCVKYRNDGVVGMDLAGDPQDPDYHTEMELHKKAFDYAHENNVNITIHAGEAEGPRSCEQAVDDFHAARVGHGYHIIDDERIYTRFKNEQHHLECCPISSYRTGSVKKTQSHPLIRFFKDGLNCSISTDDPGIMLITIFDDYTEVKNRMGLSIKNIQQMNLNAAKSCFLPDSEKSELISRLELSYAKFNQD